MRTRANTIPSGGANSGGPTFPGDRSVRISRRRSRRADAPRRRPAARRVGLVDGDATRDALLQTRDPVRAVGHGAAVPRERPFGILPRGPRRGRCGRGRPDRTSRDGSPAPDGVAGRRRSPRGRTGRIVSAIATTLFAHLVLLDASPAWKWKHS